MVCSYAHFDSSYLGLCLEIYFLSGSNELNSLNLSSPILCSRTWLLVFDHWLYQGKISTPTSANPFQDILGAVCVAPSTVLRLARCRIYSILIISKHYHQGKWYSFLVSLYYKLPVCLHCWKKEHQAMNYASQAVWPHSEAAASSDPCLF